MRRSDLQLLGHLPRAACQPARPGPLLSSLRLWRAENGCPGGSLGSRMLGMADVPPGRLNCYRREKEIILCEFLYFRVSLP